MDQLNWQTKGLTGPADRLGLQTDGKTGPADQRTDWTCRPTGLWTDKHSKFKDAPPATTNGEQKVQIKMYHEFTGNQFLKKCEQKMSCFFGQRPQRANVL